MDEKIGSAAAPRGWQPIETAPLDVPCIVGWAHIPTRKWAVLEKRVNFRTGRGPYWQDPVEHDDYNEGDQPTHWLPVPPLPPKVP